MVQKFVLEGLENKRIRELYLYKLPNLANVENWNEVKEIGYIKFKGKHANFNGALVSHKSKIYFLQESIIRNLSGLRKWKFPFEVAVVSELEWKRKVTEFQGKFKKGNKESIGHL
jgi:hypothetical protein